MTGQRFGRLTAIKRVDNSAGHNTRWLCRCDCGNERIVSRGHLRSGHTKSCGCFHSELLLRSNYKHGGSTRGDTDRLYVIWRGMIDRCYNKNNMRYEAYGGRGIKVCDAWRHNYISFREWALSHGYSDNLTIDRINNDEEYDPQNCRWADLNQQANNKRTNVLITHNGETHTQAQWSRITGISQMTIHNRRVKGLTTEEIFREA